mmetsp:Transcript_18123/g.22838  ORF Transcript_18123/g.22838 Transcript_18123/m.22838 type:complete len:82 (+) Transcript_18123:95-340(+)
MMRRDKLLSGAVLYFKNSLLVTAAAYRCFDLVQDIIDNNNFVAKDIDLKDDDGKGVNYWVCRKSKRMEIKLRYHCCSMVLM